MLNKYHIFITGILLHDSVREYSMWKYAMYISFWIPLQFSAYHQ